MGAPIDARAPAITLSSLRTVSASEEHLSAGLVNGAKSFFTQAFPEYWLFFLGLLFILVPLFLPQGVLGLINKRRERA